MIIYPDIEIQNGQSVNLPRGLREAPVTYHLSPRDAARQFQIAGAEWLHIVDLDGVFQGGRHNAQLMCQIIEEAKVPVQVAGGVRTERAVDWWFDHGVTRVVLGTVAVKDRNLLRDVCARYPDKVVVSIDARGGYALIDGWRTRTSFTSMELARNFEDVGAAAVIYTDIDRFENHPESSFAATTEIAAAIRIPVISTGTVDTLDDVSFLKYLPNISGVIVGRALFSEAINSKTRLRWLRARELIRLWQTRACGLVSLLHIRSQGRPIIGLWARSFWIWIEPTRQGLFRIPNTSRLSRTCCRNSLADDPLWEQLC